MFKKLKKFLVIPVIIAIVLSLVPMPLFTIDVLAAPRTVYWVEVGGSGTGNWSDTAHWDENISGGAGGDAVPDSDDDVIFDNNSFVSGTGTVTVDATANCLNMDWTGATNNPTFAGSSAFQLWGSLTFIEAMNRTFLGEFRAYGTGTIITNGRGLPGYVIATDGTITLGDELTCRWFRFDRGTLDTNNFGVTANIAGSTIASAGVKTLTLGSSVVDVLGWNYSGSNLTVTANTATIKITGTGAVGLGSANWNGADFNLNGTAHTVSGSPTGIAIITTPPATTQTLTITAGSVIKCTIQLLR